MAPLSPDGFADRFKASARSLWCVAVAITGDSGHAEDVLQEAALIALRKLDDFDPVTDFAAWMTQIVRYVALNARRRSRGRLTAADPSGLNDTVPARPVRDGPRITGRGDLAPDQTHFDDRVRDALAELDDTARACLLLRTVMDMPYREIALALGVPEGTAMSHVHRARRSLGRRLHELAPPSSAMTPGEAHD